MRKIYWSKLKHKKYRAVLWGIGFLISIVSLVVCLSGRGDVQQQEQVAESSVRDFYLPVNQKVWRAFELNVSVEWEATSLYLDNLSYRLRRGASFFEQATDGYFAVSKFSIYNQKENWEQSDIQVYLSLDTVSAHLRGIMLPHLHLRLDSLSSPDVIGPGLGYYILGFYDHKKQDCPRFNDAETIFASDCFQRTYQKTIGGNVNAW